MTFQNYSRRYLAEFVYGAIDGTVTTFAIISAVSGATLSVAVVLVLGFANVLADGFSMAASNYLSAKSELAVGDQSNVRRKLPFKTAAVTFFSFVLVGSLPVWPFAIFYASETINPLTVSTIATGLVFLLIGYARGRISGKSGLVAALETFLIGALAAIIAYFTGAWLQRLLV